DHVEEYYFVRAVVVDSVPIAISPREIEKASYNEEELTRVKECVKTGKLDRLRVGNTVLLKAEKTNKLSTNFNPDPFKVVHKTGSEVTLRNRASIELKRNTV
ncbi:unnamed protein product, partial [Pocillopora meandrina]